MSLTLLFLDLTRLKYLNLSLPSPLTLFYLSLRDLLYFTYPLFTLNNIILDSSFFLNSLYILSFSNISN